MTQISIQSYELIPYIRSRYIGDWNNNNGPEWLRRAINRLYMRFRENLLRHDQLTDVFHNHNEESNQTIVRYPLIQYIHREGRFFVTGINEGAQALQALAACIASPVPLSDEALCSFVMYSSSTVDVEVTQEPIAYRLTDYLPFNSDSFRTFENARLLKQKVDVIGNQLKTHIVNDFAKHLHIGLPGIEVEIYSVKGFDRGSVQLTVNRRQKDYRPFDVEFGVNALLPEHICLGVGKVYGFGYLEKAR